MKGIKHLPKAVYSPLRSSVIFFDLAKVVEELVLNSVDAGATKVHVFAGVQACYIKVEDDGYGISRDGLVLLGEKYATSKLHCLAEMDTGVESLCFRGETLSSLSDVSLLEIITKARGKPNGYRKVIKGCRCLFLGIDDCRQDVGTTVIVRDLFYNQPVRRKSMQTSSKKVLHLLKKCVLRTALVCPQISFKVIDVEGEDELLCTLPSISPLPLVASSFGNEVSSSLLGLDFSEGLFKISGYFSGPADTFSTKVFQYIYVNSRAVCKGPINKLLDSLAANLECSTTSLRDESEFQTGKRHRTQAYLAYMLNLCCPQSTYDLTFEPSKTVVEFKEWSPVLSFIEKAVKHFWRQFPSHFFRGESCGHEGDIRGKGKMCKDSENNALPLKGTLIVDLAETSGNAKKRSKMQHNQSLAYISPSTSLLEMSSADIDFLSDQNHRSLSRESYTNILELEGRQLKTSHNETGYTSGNMISVKRDVAYPECGQLTCPKGSFHLTSDINFLPVEDHFLLEGSVLKQTTEDDPRDGILHSRWKNESFDVGGALQKCKNLVCKNDAGKVSFLSHGEDALKSAIFGHSPSVLGVPDDPTLFSNHKGSMIQFDDLRTEIKWFTPVDTIDEIFLPTPLKKEQAVFQLSPGVTRKCKSVTESDVLSYSNACDGVCFTEESGLENDSFAQCKKRGSTCQFTNSSWCSGSPYSLSAAAYWKDGELAGLYATEKNFISCQIVNSRDFSDRDEKELFFCNEFLQSSSKGDGCYTPVCTNTRIDCETCFSPKENMDKFLSHGHEFPHKKILLSCEINNKTCLDSSSSDTSDNHSTFTFCIPSPSCNKMGGSIREKGHIWNCGQQHVPMVRSRRSHSAPPFYKGRKKFSSLYNCLTAQTGTEPKHQSLISAPDAVTHCELKDSSKSCSASLSFLQPVLSENSLPYSRTCIKGAQNNCGFEKSFCSQPCNSHTSEDFVSNELQHSQVTLTKWRSGDSRPTDGGKLHKLPEQEDEILDISSGILHLAGGSFVPESIKKDSLRSAKVLPQLDRKFIPVVADGTLAIIDQHAADERIRLEELRRKVLSGEEKTIAYLDSEQELVLPEIGFQLLQNYTEQIQEWGWICNIHAQGSGPFRKNMNLLHKQSFTVTLVAVPCILGINLSDKDLVEFLEQLAETDGTSTMPPAVLRILNFKACRGAIMFGDSLLPYECSLIVEELKATSLCFQDIVGTSALGGQFSQLLEDHYQSFNLDLGFNFCKCSENLGLTYEGVVLQCAHGRPTTVPIVNMEALHKQLAKLQLQNGDSPEQWHGLRRHKPSLERAKLRSSRPMCV